MGLGDIDEKTEEEDDTSSSQNSSSSGGGRSRGKTTTITFKNPGQADIRDGKEDRHRQEYYDAVKHFRSQMGGSVNVAAGEFFAGAREAHDGDKERICELLTDTATQDGLKVNAQVARYLDAIMEAHRGNIQPLKNLFEEIANNRDELVEK